MARLILYVGRQKNRPDDVLKTARVWKGNGDVVSVEDTEAPHYLQHPGEWKEVTPEQYEKLKAEQAQASKVKDEAEREFAKLSINDMIELRDRLNVAISNRLVEHSRAQVIDKPTAEVAASEPVQHNTDDPASRDAALARTRKVIEAINSLDRNNPEQWFKPRNQPRVEAVSEIVGSKVSATEIAQAMDLIAQSLSKAA